MLWLAYDHTGEQRYAMAARNHAETMAAAMPQSTMFRGLCFNFAGFGGYEITDDERERALGLEGAASMLDYFHEDARSVPIGTLSLEVPEHIVEDFRSEENEISGEITTSPDNLHTALPPLWRAYHETGHPKYRDVAVSHADRSLNWVIRDDGSTWNIVHFDPETGDLVAQFNDLAYSDDTTWARGQGWYIAGLCRAYLETRAERYLHALERVVEYFVSHSPDTLVPFWDFEHPDIPDVPRDTSCAAISAYGLSLLPETNKTQSLRAIGERIVESLTTNYLTPLPDEAAGVDRPVGMTLEGCYNGPQGFADHYELIWTDHYLMAALHQRLSDTGDR